MERRRVVSKEELLDTVWGNTFVTESGEDVSEVEPDRPFELLVVA